MSDTSATLSLPYLMPAQAQKHVTHNDALDRLDLVVQLVVTAFDATNPPHQPNRRRVLRDWSNSDGRMGRQRWTPYGFSKWRLGLYQPEKRLACDHGYRRYQTLFRRYVGRCAQPNCSPKPTRTGNQRDGR